ncbi:MAG TPA: alcohol dehydrogenase catalytic domain-containing protein [Chloroflexota bacterium]|nr:alcohol dehydrogenase catalytic domain-containing protein [Chloroflexota bacterium]
MRAMVFHGVNDVHLTEVPVPTAGVGEAVVKVTLTTICGTDVHIAKGEWPVEPGRILGHEPVGIVHDIGPGLVGYHVGQRVLVGAITPCGTCFYCLKGQYSQCAGYDGHWVPGGGWRLGNSIDGCQAEYVRVPYAQANLTPIPDGLSDEAVVLLSDIASTGFSASEKANVTIGDTVAVFAQGPIGLCAAIGARLKGAGLVIVVDSIPERLAMAKRLGADVALNFKEQDVVSEIRRLTNGRGVDVAIEALGTPQTFGNALKSIRPGGTVSSLGIYSKTLEIAPADYVGGLGDQCIVNTLCPGGKERMRSLMSLVQHHRIDLTPLLTHRFSLDRIEEAYGLFGRQEDAVLKVGA